MARKRGESARPEGAARGGARDAGGLSATDRAWLSAWQRKVRRRSFRLRNLDATDYVGWLHYAVEIDALDAARRLIEWGADVNASHEIGAGYSPLQVAALRGNLEMVRTLIGFGADPNHEGREGTALMCAVRWKRLAIYEYLRPLTNRREQEIVARRLSEARRSPDEHARAIRFSEVSLRGLLPTFQRLLKQGIDVDARTSGYTGKTPLTLAAQKGRAVMVEQLLAAGADPNLESYQGVTPLMVVSDAEVCRLLLAAGADVDARDDDGRSVLMRVKDEACRRLIRKASRGKRPGRRGG